jgi:hypothetical protein
MGGIRYLWAGVALCLAAAGSVRAEVVINEIMYHSPGAEDIEFVELYNAGPGAQDLTDWYLLDADDAHDRCYLVGTLGAGEYLMVVGRFDYFSNTYPGVLNLNPNPFDNTLPGTGFALGNAADTVRLFDATHSLVDSVSYEDGEPWPAQADGAGSSLELIHPGLDNSLAGSWAASVSGPPGGTPGGQNSVFVDDLPPVIGELTRDPALPAAHDAVNVTAKVTDSGGVTLVAIHVHTGGGFEMRSMYDDGLHGDGGAADAVYGATIEDRPHGSLVRYYVEAFDTTVQRSAFPPGAPADYLAYTVGHSPPALQVSEVMASNQNGILDEMGENEDWIEIRNRSPEMVDLAGMFLTEDPDDTKMWAFPTRSVGPGQRVVVWCDGEPADGALHANFRLAKTGGELWLYDSVDHGNTLVHGMTFGIQNPDVSFGYTPDDADAPEYFLPPTPGGSNNDVALYAPVCVNEFLASSQIGGVPDWVELYNRSGATVDLGGWHVTDDVGLPQRYTFPAGTLLAPGAHLSLGENDLGFGFAADGGEVIMLARPGALIGQDYFDYGPQSPDVSQGRLPDGTANWHFFANWSRDVANACPVGIVPLPAVPSLLFVSGTALTWDALEEAEVYDVVRGNLIALRANGGELSSALDECLENNSADCVSFDQERPPSGSGYFYLVRGATRACRFGSYHSDADLSDSACP